MFVLKHAFLNLKRHSWNYLIVCIILFVLILGIMVTNTIYTSTKVFANGYSEKFPVIVSVLEPDLSNITSDKKLTKEQYLKFGESKYVAEVKMVASVPILLNTLKTIVMPSTNQFKKLEGNEGVSNFYQATVKWLGASPDNIIAELNDINMEITVGSSKLNLNECLISNELAQLNKLKTGDTIQITVIGDEITECQTLTIAGIYQLRKKVQSVDSRELMMTHENNIFTNLETIHAMENFGRLGYNNISYKLKSLKDLDCFLEEMKKKGWPSDYQLMTNEVILEILLSPIGGVGTLSVTILLGFFVFGNYILVLFSLRIFRQRQIELCVLCNHGIKKKQLIECYMVELFVVAGVSFIIALVATKRVVQPIANWLLQNQKILIGNIDQLFSGISKENVETINSIPMVFTKGTLVNTLGLTALFLITIISIVSYKVFKFEPVEFLLERKIDE